MLVPGGDPGVFLSYGTDDEEVIHDEVAFTLGPPWENLSQVSASVSLSSVISDDTDVVDHSRWVVGHCRWKPVPTPDGERIHVKVNIQTQGAGNGWTNLAYQVVATGTLKRMPTPEEVSADFS